MGWKLKGHYVQACSCRSVCPCPTASSPPDNPDGTTDCWGAGVFDITEGNLDDLSLSGVRVGMTVHFPEIVSNGNWHIGLMIDDAADAAQAAGLEQIFGGKLGGPFGDMAGLISEFTVARGALSYSESSVSMGGSSYTYEPSRGQDGSATTVTNAAFGFAPVFEIGTATGTLEAFGHTAPASYGEAADFEYASESHEHIRA